MALDKKNLRNFIILLFWLLVFIIGLFVAVRVNNSVDGIKKNLDLASQGKNYDANQSQALVDKIPNKDQDEELSLKIKVQWKQYRNYQFGFAFDYPGKFKFEEGRVDDNGQFNLKIYPDVNSNITVNVGKADKKSFDLMSDSQMYTENKINGIRLINASGYHKNYLYQVFRFLGDDYEYEFVYQDDRIKIDVFNQFENVVEGHVLDSEVDKVNQNLVLLEEMINSFYLLDDEKP